MKPELAEDRAALYRQFLGRSFRDIQQVDIGHGASIDTVGGRPQTGAAAPSPSPPPSHPPCMYHSNFLRAICRVDGALPGAGLGGASGGRPRIVDVKPIQCAPSESSPHFACSDLVGFAVLCTTGAPASASSHAQQQQSQSRGNVGRASSTSGSGMYCVVQLFHDPVPDFATTAATTPNPIDDCCSSISDCAMSSHSPFTVRARWVVQLPDALPSTRLSYVGGGVLLFLSTSSNAGGRVDYVDLLTASEKPMTVTSAERVSMEPREIISAKATAVRSTSSPLSTDVIVSCVTRRSHFTIKFERLPNSASATPRAPQQAGRLVVSTSGVTQVHTMDHPPCHIALSSSVALIFLPIKLEKKWALLRVTDNWQECQGKNVLEGIDLKCKVTCAEQYVARGEAGGTMVVIGSEDGHVGILPRQTNEGSEVRTTAVFEGSDPQQRAITRIEQMSTPGAFAVYSRTSAALVYVDAGGGVTLSRKVSPTVTGYALLHLHLHKDISANPNYVLLSADVNATNVQMHTFLNTACLEGCAATIVQHAGRPSPPASNRDLHLSSTALPPALSSMQSPPQQPSPSSASLTSTGTQNSTGLFGKLSAVLKAKLGRKSSGSNGMGTDQFVSRVGAPVAVYCDGFCRKSLTSSGDQHRVLSLDIRLHGFLVWLRMHDQDELLLLRDTNLPHGLSTLHREDL